MELSCIFFHTSRHTHNVADIEGRLYRYVLILYGFVFYYDPEYIKKTIYPQCGLFERDTNPISQEIHV